MDQKVKQSQKKIPQDKSHQTPQKSLNQSLNSSKNLENDSISFLTLAQYYKEQHAKINLWTYLFKSLNQILQQVFIQCEIEKNKELCEGVVLTLNNAITDFQKLIHSIEIENTSYYYQTNNKPVAWEVPTKSQEQKDPLNISEYEHFIQDLEDADSVDFALFTQLVNDKKMTFEEAIVLLVRERAMLINESELTNPVHLVLDNNSFISKGSMELFDQYEREDLAKKGISLTKLLQRLSYKLSLSERRYDPDQSQIVEKQVRAEKIRKDQECVKQEQIKKEKEKVQAARDKLEQKRQKQQEQIKQKLDEADQRYENHLNEIRKKARIESDKANEIAFITMLEIQNRKITIDEKLQETLERKKEIENKILNEKIKIRKIKEDEVKRKRKEFEDEKFLKLKQKEIKRDEADTKRTKRLEEEKKRQVDELNKVTKALKDKKEKDQTIELTFEAKLHKLKERFQKEQANLHRFQNKNLFDLTSEIMSSTDENENQCYRQVKSIPELKVSDSLEFYEKPIVFFNLEQRNQLKKQVQQQAFMKSTDSFTDQENQMKSSKKRKQKKHPSKSKEIPKDSLPVEQKFYRNLSVPSLFRSEDNSYHIQRKNRKLKLLPLIRNDRCNEDVTQTVKSPKSIISPNYKQQPQQEFKDFQEEQSLSDVQYYRLCQICNFIIPENESDIIHLSSNQHKQTKIYYNLTTNQDDIIQIKGQKEDLTNNRFNAIRKRCQKIKLKIQKKSLILENSNIYSSTKEVMSQNKQRIQKICNDLDKQINNQIKDLDIIENLFKDLNKILDNQKEIKDNDLIVLRQLKFVTIVVELFKKVSVCRKHEYGQYLKIIGIVSSIMYQFCQNFDNKTYLIVGNRILPIVDFLYSLLATKPTKFIYGFSFVPQLFQILSILIKHKLPRDPLNDNNIQEIQEDFIEYLFCSGLFHKMKLRFQCFEKDYINSEGKIPLALVKSITFLDAVTNYHGFDIMSKPVYEEPSRPNKNFLKHINFVLEETDMFGIIHLMSQMIVGEGVSIKNNRMIPQTTLSFLQVGIKTLNNIARLNLSIFQNHMNNQQNKQETHMIMLSLLNYCKESMNQSEEIKDLLNELILMIGYYCLMNTTNQNSLLSGIKQISILHNLCDLPPHFYIDKQLINVLFPTLICCVFQNQNNMEILLNFNSKDYFVKFIAKEYKELNLSEHDNEKITTEHFLQRSPSISSTNSSQNSVFPHSSAAYYKLCQRFPVQFYLEALKEFNEFQENK